MGRGPRSEPLPRLAEALRHLRLDARLTQAGVVERVRQLGGSISGVYYQQIESGRRFPSPGMRAQILAALGSDEQAFARLLAERPWEALAQGAVRASRRPGTPAAAEVRHDRTFLPMVDMCLADHDPVDPDAARAEIAALANSLSGPALLNLLEDARRRADEARHIL